MPSTITAATPKKQGGRRKRKKDVYVPPIETRCPNGFAFWPDTASAVEPPALRPASYPAHGYTFPSSRCSDVTSQYTRGCTYCRSNVSAIQNELNRFGNSTLSALLYDTEQAMGRRMTYTEAYDLYYEASGNGVRNVLERYPDPATRSAMIQAKKHETKKLAWEKASEQRERQAKAIAEQAKLVRGKEKALQVANQAKRLASLEKALTSPPKGNGAAVLIVPPVHVGPPRPPANQYGELPCGHSAVVSSLRPLCFCHDPQHPDNPRRRSRPSECPVSPNHGIPFVLDKKTPGNDRLVGVEVEYNNPALLERWVNRWHGAIHTDGSCGYEAVTTPIAGGHINACLAELCTDLKNQNTKADKRCGIHVHVDANDMTWDCMRRLIATYAKVEPILYILAGQERMQGNYCRPCGKEYSGALKQEDWKDAVLGVALAAARNGIRPSELAKQRPGKKGGDRYRGLNIMPWIAGRRVSAPDTTVEFRMHRNTLDGARIAGWARLLAAMVEWAVSASDKEVKNLPKSGLRAIVQVIAPDESKWVLSRVKAWRSVTTYAKDGRSNEAGLTLAARRIGVKGGWHCKTGEEGEEE